MVARIRNKGVRPHLYIAEHMDSRGLSDQTLGDRMDVSRQTVYRWRTDQKRLDPFKIAALAAALDREPEELWRPPARRSLDAILKAATDDQLSDAIDFVERFILKRA